MNDYMISGRKPKKGKKGKKKKAYNGGMNDDSLEYHSESDEGVNQDNINFDGNDQFVFKKRQ